MATLYEIQNDLLNLFDQIEEAEGEITPEQSEASIEKELNPFFFAIKQALINS